MTATATAAMGDKKSDSDSDSGEGDKKSDSDSSDDSGSTGETNAEKKEEKEEEEEKNEDKGEELGNPKHEVARLKKDLDNEVCYAQELEQKCEQLTDERDELKRLVEGLIEENDQIRKKLRPQQFWCLTVMSFKPVLNEVLLPLVLPLMLNYGILVLGWPGVGKTPLVITMLMALGRYHVLTQGLETAPGWRRGKTFDSFKYRAPRIEEGLFLDDPNAASIGVEDWKAWADGTQDGTVSCRYHDAKIKKNQARGAAMNEVDEEDEPDANGRTTLTPAECNKLVHRPFIHYGKAHILAILKRNVTFVFGKKALYVRLPSKTDEALMHRITDDDVHLDALAEFHKDVYGKYLDGGRELPASFDHDVSMETKMMQAGVTEMLKHPTKEVYITYCNEYIQKKLMPIRFVPESPPPSQGSPETLPLESDGTWLFPGLPPGLPCVPASSGKRFRFAADFSVATPRRRICHKSAASAKGDKQNEEKEEEEEKEKDIGEEATETMADQYDADEEAARAMGEEVTETMADQYDADEEAARAMHADDN